MKKLGLLLLCICQINLLHAGRPQAPQGRLALTRSQGNKLYIATSANREYRHASITMNTPGYAFKSHCPDGLSSCQHVKIPLIAHNHYLRPLEIEGPLGTYKFTISLSSISSSGQPTARATTEIGFGQINASIPLTTPYAVVSNVGSEPQGNTLSFCQINNTPGASYGALISPCIPESASVNGTSSFSNPAGGFYNPGTGVLYITNQAGFISVCTFEGNIESMICSRFSDPTFAAPSGAVLSEDQTLLYVTNGNSQYISVCSLNTQGQIINNSNGIPSCGTINVGIPYLSGIAINTLNNPNMLYVSSDGGYSSNAISECNIMNSSCINTNAATIDQASGLALSPDSSVLYATNNGGSNNVTTCPVNSGSVDGASCTIFNDSTFANPEDIDLFVGTSTFAYIANFNGALSICPIIANALQPCTSFSDSSFLYQNGITVIQPA